MIISRYARLMNCSDNHLAHVCGKCGGMISVYAHSGDYASSFSGAGTFILSDFIFFYFYYFILYYFILFIYMYIYIYRLS